MINLTDEELDDIGGYLCPPSDNYHKIIGALKDAKNLGEMLHILDIVEPVGLREDGIPMLGPLRELALWIEAHRSQKVDRAFDDLRRKISVRLVR